MTYSDVIDKLGQIRQNNLDLINSQIPPVKGDLTAAHPPGELPPYKKPDKPNSPYEPYKSPIPSRDDRLANLRPQDFTPFDMDGVRDMEGFLIPHIRTPAIRDAEMKHFKRFIKNTGESTWDLSQGNSPMMIAKGKKKKKKGLTIYDEAARRDAFRDMADEPYDPDTGRMGGGFDIMNDVLGLDEA